jgi:protoheme ferro-lyase
MTTTQKINRVENLKNFSAALILCVSINGFSISANAQQQFTHTATYLFTFHSIPQSGIKQKCYCPALLNKIGLKNQHKQ